MTTLALRLAGPLQAWGSRSRFTRRETDRAPTKSGVIGLLAAALGVLRTESEALEPLRDLQFGTRIDQPGRILRDFQTARSLDGARSMPLSYRYYLTDAVFVTVIEGDADLLHRLHDAVQRPVFPLYLGRRSCPPMPPVTLEVSDGSLRERLAAVPWQASKRVQERHQSERVELEAVVEAYAKDEGAETVRDVPLSFDPRLRQYGWRSVVRYRIEDVPRQFPADQPTEPAKPSGSGEPSVPDHEPMSIAGGG